MTDKPWLGKSVVIIDDSRRVREELAAAFKEAGMQVVGEAENGALGLAQIAKHNPEVISLDLIMPEMDGVECYKKIIAKNPDQKVMMVTWLGGEVKILENLKDLIPAHLFQPKPVNAHDLTQRLERIYFPHLAATAKLGAKSPADTVDEFLDLGVKVS